MFGSLYYCVQGSRDEKLNLLESFLDGYIHSFHLRLRTNMMTKLRFIQILLPWLSLLTITTARTTSGEFRLSGLNTEYVLGSFAVSAKSKGVAVIALASKDPYRDDRTVRMRLYKDDTWPQYLKEPSCMQKVPHAMQSEEVQLKQGLKQGSNYQAEITFVLDNMEGDRTRYFYFVIDDCSLELYMHDDAVPLIHFTLKTFDGGSHFSADETHLNSLHTVTMMISGILAFLMAAAIGIQLYEQSSVHASMFWVTLAAFCDSASSFFELMHLWIYKRNGVGNYTMDAISAHMEALCDSLVALLLLSVASGWTLPSDVISVTQNATPIQRLLEGLRSPFSALKTFNATAIMAITILVLHLVLAQWGRMYNDEFDSYHDYSYLPGKLLMGLRSFLGLCLLVCCFQTRSRCHASLHGFYLKLAFVGTVWFQSLPFVTWFSNWMIAYHLQHFSVGVWSAVMQTSSIVLLCWLVTSHSTSFHKLSHMVASKEDLTDSLATVGSKSSEESRVWVVGKAKVRLD